MLRSEGTVTWVQGQEARAEGAVMCLPAPVLLSQLPLLSRRKELQAQPPMVDLRQDGMSSKGNPVFDHLLCL